MPSHPNNGSRLPDPFGGHADKSMLTGKEDQDVITITGGSVSSGRKRTATKSKKDEDGEDSDYQPKSHISGSDQARPVGRPRKRIKSDIQGIQKKAAPAQSRGRNNFSDEGASKPKGKLHPDKACMTYYKKQAIEHRKEIKVLEKQIEERDWMVGTQQQNLHEMQNRVTSLEEALLDRTKMGTVVKVDTGRVRGAFEEISKMCKDWAMSYRRSGTVKECLNDTESALVYSTLKGKKSLKRQLISTEGKDILWKHETGIYMLLHAILYYFACTEVLEDWLFFIKGDEKSRALPTEAGVLEHLFEMARHEDEGIANEWRLLSVKLLKTIVAKSHTSVNADLPSGDQASKEQFYRAATTKLLKKKVVQFLLGDIGASREMERQEDLAAIFHKAGTVGLQLWSQGFVIETGGTSEADFARVFEADDPMRRSHSVMKTGGKNTSMDGTKVCLVLEPTIFGKRIAHESLGQKPTMYSKSLVLALKPLEPPVAPQAYDGVTHESTAAPEPVFTNPASPVTPNGQDELLHTYRHEARHADRNSPTRKSIGPDLLPGGCSLMAKGPQQIPTSLQSNDGRQKQTSEFQGTGNPINNSRNAAVPMPATGNPAYPGQAYLPSSSEEHLPENTAMGILIHAQAPQGVDHHSAEESLHVSVEPRVAEDINAQMQFADQLVAQAKTQSRKRSYYVPMAGSPVLDIWTSPRSCEVAPTQSAETVEEHMEVDHGCFAEPHASTRRDRKLIKQRSI